MWDGGSPRSMVMRPSPTLLLSLRQPQLAPGPDLGPVKVRSILGSSLS